MLQPASGLAGKIRGAVYVAVAGIDPWLAPGETERLREALEAAGIRHRIEDYPGVQHGFGRQRHADVRPHGRRAPFGSRPRAVRRDARLRTVPTSSF